MYPLTGGQSKIENFKNPSGTHRMTKCAECEKVLSPKEVCQRGNAKTDKEEDVCSDCMWLCAMCHKKEGKCECWCWECAELETDCECSGSDEE
jgi:hypothetical protein